VVIYDHDAGFAAMNHVEPLIAANPALQMTTTQVSRR
jgi:hypothetical protein